MRQCVSGTSVIVSVPALMLAQKASLVFDFGKRQPIPTIASGTFRVSGLVVGCELFLFAPELVTQVLLDLFDG